MDIPIYENQRIAGGYNILDIGATDDMAFDDEFIEVCDCLFLIRCTYANPVVTSVYA